MQSPGCFTLWESLKDIQDSRNSNSVCPHHIDTRHFNQNGIIIIEKEYVVSHEFRRGDVNQITNGILPYAVMFANHHFMEAPDCSTAHAPSALRLRAVLRREMTKTWVVGGIRIVQVQRSASELKSS